MVRYVCEIVIDTHTNFSTYQFRKDNKMELRRIDERAIEEKRSCYLCNGFRATLWFKLFRYSLGCRDATVGELKFN